MNEPVTTFFEHPMRPTWGRCLLVSERDGKLFLFGEDGAEHVIAVTHRSALQQLALDENQAAELRAAIEGKREESTTKRKKPGERKAAPIKARISFDEQLRRFEEAYPGGFSGERFSTTERGPNGPDGPKGDRQAALELAARLLGADSLTAESGYAAATELIKATNLLHPMEGQIPFKSLTPEAQTAFATALRELLHGAGEYGPRFDAYVASIAMTERDGKAKRPSWPLATYLPALFAPTEQVFVKPKLLREQADMLEIRFDYDPSPSAALYEQFRAVARALEGRLRERGHAPRDLMDVTSFVAITLGGEITPAAPAPED